MNILVTGGAGFIGSHVCDALLKRGDKVICIDNLNSYYSQKRKIKNVIHNLDNPNFTLLIEDIVNKEKVEEIFKSHKIDKIIHLAARAGVRFSLERPDLYVESNIQGTINLLEMGKKYNVKNFIFGSSSSVYGNNKKIPFSEEDPVDKPISPYGVSKRACEIFCYTYYHLFNMNVTCLRLFTVYGPRGRPDMAPYIFTECIDKGKELVMYGDGSTKRDYTFITDIVAGIIAALDKNLDFEIINLGNSKPIKLRYFISLIEKILSKKANIIKKPVQQGDVKLTYAGITKAKRLLNWQPKIEIEDGMKKFIEWYKNER